jgi:hypothetical protein
LVVHADEQGREGNAEEAEGEGVHIDKVKRQPAEEPQAMEVTRQIMLEMSWIA